MSTPNDPLLEGLKPADLLKRGLDTVKPPSGTPLDWQPPEPEVLAQLLPQYQIESLLGRGGMGAVYRGKQVALDRAVAIKLLPAELTADAEFVGRFQREARTLARMQHPGIVSVYDFGQTSQGHLYFIMEYVDGTDLHRVIHGPGLKPAQVLEIVAQVCEALQYAHSQGVMHRDIKPANVLLTQDGRAKLADFGLARPTQEDSGGFTRSNVVMGTPDYIAPEQLYGQSDHRADLFSLGVMLYEMLTGQTPRGAWSLPSQRVRVDVRLDQVVLRALQQDVSLRYQQASEMKTDVDQIRFTPPASPKAAPGKAVPAAAPAKPAAKQAAAPPASPARKHRKKSNGRLVFLGVTLPLVLLAGGYGWLSRKHEAQARRAEEPARPAPAPAADPQRALAPSLPVPPTQTATMTTAPAPPPTTTATPPQQTAALELAVPVPDWLKQARQKGGRLKLFGTWKGQAISLGKAVEFDDFVKVVTSEHGWAAVRKNGETYAATWPNGHLPPFQTQDVSGGHLISLLLKDSDGLGYKILWHGESLRRDEVVHPQAYTCLHPYQLVLALSQDGRILKTSEWGGSGKKIPPSDFFRGFTAVASTQDHCLVAKPGQPLEGWNITDGSRTRFPARLTDVVAMDATSQSVITLTRSGSPSVFSLSDRAPSATETSVPPDLGPMIAVKAGRTMYAAQRPDGTWCAWGHAEDLISQTERNGLMLDVDYDYQPGISRVMMWIEATSGSVPSADPAPKVAATPAPMTTTPPAAIPIKSGDKPAEDAAGRLAELAIQFQAAYDRDIGSSLNINVADLDRKYLAAVQRALESASAAGGLDEAVQLREEEKRVQNKAALPSYDFDTLPASLKNLRKTYREALARLILASKMDAQPLYERYDAVLAAYQTELTQQRLLDDAMKVRTVREKLSLQRTQNPEKQAATAPPNPKGTQLFDGKTLTGWRIEGEKKAFSVVGGLLKANGQKASLICTEGPWKNFELNLKVMTELQGNSGVWIHTPKNPRDISKPGLEVQICNNGVDSQKTGSIYSVQPQTRLLARDGQWFDLKIVVQEKTIRVFINGRQVNEWTQPAGWRPPPSVPTAELGSGTIGLQSNGGLTWFKDLFIRPL
ncbi:family 16 glycoside hydrolase [Prosthecobacter sp. SYSU 5D2]|uniref:protein kinase domain-containing protein n=1 Tax=Prosthecobacter sp. SYSU 5D2 TaxID=3134134 RepID=UPI0031FE745F